MAHIWYYEQDPARCERTVSHKARAGPLSLSEERKQGSGGRAVPERPVDPRALGLATQLARCTRRAPSLAALSPNSSG